MSHCFKKVYPVGNRINYPKRQADRRSWMNQAQYEGVEMNTDKTTPQEISEEALFTPEGHLTTLAHEELHKHIAENYGRVKILSKEPSVVDVLSENLDPDESQQ